MEIDRGNDVDIIFFREEGFMSILEIVGCVLSS